MGLPTFLFKEKFYTCRNSTCIVFRVVDRASRLGKVAFISTTYVQLLTNYLACHLNTCMSTLKYVILM